MMPHKVWQQNLERERNISPSRSALTTHCRRSSRFGTEASSQLSARGGAEKREESARPDEAKILTWMTMRNHVTLTTGNTKKILTFGPVQFTELRNFRAGFRRDKNAKLNTENSCGKSPSPAYSADALLLVYSMESFVVGTCRYFAGKMCLSCWKLIFLLV